MEQEQRDRLLNKLAADIYVGKRGKNLGEMRATGPFIDADSLPRGLRFRPQLESNLSSGKTVVHRRKSTSQSPGGHRRTRKNRLGGRTRLRSMSEQYEALHGKRGASLGPRGLAAAKAPDLSGANKKLADELLAALQAGGAPSKQQQATAQARRQEGRRKGTRAGRTVRVVRDGKPAPSKGKSTLLGWAKDVGKKTIDADSLAKGLRSALGKGALLGGGILAARVAAKMAPKKTLIQKLIGEGTVGRKALMFGAGGAALAGGLKGTEALADSVLSPMKKQKYFDKMLEENPSLKKERPSDVSKIFRTLYKFNPTMASDPLVAGSFLKRSLQFKDEGIQPIDVKTLTEVAKHLSESKKKDSLLRGAFAGSGAELLSYVG